MSILKELPKRKWVPTNSKDFLTIQEIMEETGEGRNWTERYVKSMLSSGKWEVRFKKIGNRSVRAVGHE